MTHVWFVLPDGKRLATQVLTVPRPGDVVRFAGDGEPYEVELIEHIATREGTRRGMRYVKILIRLSAMAAEAS